MPHTSRISVRFCDIDVMGHVNNAVYLNYFEQARMAFFHDLIGSEWDWKKDGIILARNEVDYLLPLLLQEHVRIDTSVGRIGTKSLTLSYEVYDETSEGRKVYARGSSVIVCFDFVTGQTCGVPELWRERMTVED